MICLCMIVKNEASIIERCLNSVKDLIDTWCIIDTGSTDNTKELVKEALKDIPGKLIREPWVNFGHNRTQAYNYAREMGEWVLFIDADHIIEDKGFLEKDLDKIYTHYNLEQRSKTLSYQNKRLLNTKKDWKCIGVTHEYWDVNGSHGEKLESLAIIDLGDGGSKEDKFERDLKLLRKGLKEEPKNTRYKFYLAQTHKDLGHFKKAYHWYDVCLKESKWDEEVWYCEYMKAYCLVMSNAPIDEIETQAMKAWLLRPWRAEPVYVLSKLFKEKDWQKCYHLLKLCLTIDYPHNDILFVEHQLYLGLAQDELSIAAYWINNKQESLDLMKNLLRIEYGKSIRERLEKNIQLVYESIIS
jgi:glycosyltransferase involved in cell wall biosynthesis